MKPCAHCDRPARKRGMCSTHYNRWLRRGNPLAEQSSGGGIPDGMRAFVEAQRYRAERPSVPCFHCGQREGCDHRRKAA